MIYTIQRGDTLSELAKRFGTTTEALARANGIADPDKIYAGSKLTVPSTTPLTLWGAIKKALGW